jgi:hypothetical protein
MATRKDEKMDPTAQFKPWLDITQAKAFLSSEFLLWLWHFTESPQNPVSLRLLSTSQEILVKLWIEDRMVLESSDAKAHVQTLRGGEPSRSREAESALQTGKMVRELRLGLHIDPYGDFLVILNAKDLAPRSVLLPSGQADDTGLQSVGLAYRLKMTDLLVDTLDSLFALFLEHRTDERRWAATSQSLEAWIESRGHAETHLH